MFRNDPRARDRMTKKEENETKFIFGAVSGGLPIFGPLGLYGHMTHFGPYAYQKS